MCRIVKQPLTTTMLQNHLRYQKNPCMEPQGGKLAVDALGSEWLSLFCARPFSQENPRPEFIFCSCSSKATLGMPPQLCKSSAQDISKITQHGPKIEGQGAVGCLGMPYWSH